MSQAELGLGTAIILTAGDELDLTNEGNRVASQIEVLLDNSVVQARHNGASELVLGSQTYYTDYAIDGKYDGVEGNGIIKEKESEVWGNFDKVECFQGSIRVWLTNR
jgi:hypothetical protein